jgi:pyruvate dehydrogenase E1 component beta subunit
MAVLTYLEALRQGLTEEMQRDDRIFIMGEDVDRYGSSYGVTMGFRELFGEKRLRDTPIAEAAIIGSAVGAAMAGLRPIAELMTVNFSLVAMDQIINNAAKVHYMFGGQMRAPVVIRTANGYGALAATHSQNFDSFFAYIPGLKVVAPSTPYDVKGLIKACLRQEDPVIFLEHVKLYSVRGEVPDEEYEVPLGVSDVKRQGRDITVVAWSWMATRAMEAAAELADDGIEVEVVDPRSLRPIDWEPIVASVRKTSRALVLDEGWRTAGLGAEFAASISEHAFDYLDAPVERLAAVEAPMPYARNLEAMCIPSVEQIVAKVRQIVD